jgi:hypothetical protein
MLVSGIVPRLLTTMACVPLARRHSERRCAEAAKLMMQRLLPSFELVNPLPP